MTVKEQLLQEIERLPEALLEQVLNFLLFVKQELKSQFHTEIKSKLLDDDPPSSEEQVNSSSNVLLAIKEIGDRVPDDEWANLPSDFAKNIRHYLYGAEKEE